MTSADLARLAGHGPVTKLEPLLKDIRNPFNAGGELFAEALKNYVRTLEDHLGEDQQLVLENRQGSVPMRVFRMAFPTGRTLVLIGVDAEQNETHYFAHVSTVQLEIKIIPKDPGEERTRIGFQYAMQDEDEGE